MSFESQILLLDLQTPALVYDEDSIDSVFQTLSGIRNEKLFKVLYSMKACSLFSVMKIISPNVDGFSCSTNNEIELATRIARRDQVIQTVSPTPAVGFVVGHRAPDLLTFNTIEQARRSETLQPEMRAAIRVNPETSFVRNNKYDPCRVASKLGATVPKILKELKSNSAFRERISGLHFHNNCESENFVELQLTVDRISPLLESHEFKWINLGGGYRFVDVDLAPLGDLVRLLRARYGLEVFIEPGGGVVRDAGYLVSTIIDMFESDGKQIAILDTAVNHAPEVFEYDWSPPTLNSCLNGKYSYIFAGCSCLAGDVFGEYSFNKPKKLGDRVVFGEMGAYSTAKTSWFNGISMPNIYILTQDGELDLRKTYTYEDFARHCGVDEVAIN